MGIAWAITTEFGYTVLAMNWS